MNQAIVAIVFGLIGTLLAQWLTEIHSKASAAVQAAREAGETPDFSLVQLEWMSDVSNGDVLALIQILLIVYLYGRLREVQRQIAGLTPKKAESTSILQGH